MADRDRLGLAGGPRGVDGVSDVVRVQADLGRGGRLAGEFGGAGHDQPGLRRREASRPRGRSGSPRDGPRRTSGPAAPAAATGRAAGTRSPAFSSPEQAADRLGAAVEVDADHGFGAGPQAGQVAGQPVPRLVELAVGQPRSRGHDGGRLRPPGRLLGDHLVDEGPDRAARGPPVAGPPVAGPPVATARTLAGVMSGHRAAMASRQARLDIAADCRRHRPAGRNPPAIAHAGRGR